MTANNKSWDSIRLGYRLPGLLFQTQILLILSEFPKVLMSTPNLRTSHSKQLLQPFAKCCSFYNSFFLFILFVCGTHFLPTLFIVVALELLKVSLGLLTLFRCLCFSVCFLVCLFLCHFAFEVPHISPRLWY